MKAEVAIDAVVCLERLLTGLAGGKSDRGVMLIDPEESLSSEERDAVMDAANLEWSRIVAARDACCGAGDCDECVTPGREEPDPLDEIQEITDADYGDPADPYALFRGEDGWVYPGVGFGYPRAGESIVAVRESPSMRRVVLETWDIGMRDTGRGELVCWIHVPAGEQS